MPPAANRAIRATNDAMVPYWCSSNRCRPTSLSFTASPSVLGNCYATLGSVANRTAGLRSSLTLTGSCGDREAAGNEGGLCLHATHADVPNLPCPDRRRRLEPCDLLHLASASAGVQERDLAHPLDQPRRAEDHRHPVLGV